MKHWPFYIALTSVLLSCGAHQTSESGSIIPPESTQGAPADTVTTLGTTLQRIDWFDALEVFANRWPTYAGYTFTADGSRLILFTTDNRSENARKMHDEFVELTRTSAGVPEIDGVGGNAVDVSTLPFTYQRAAFSRRQMNGWRASLRQLMYTGLVNKLSITDESNHLNVQVPGKEQQAMLMTFLQQQAIPREVMNITLGVNIINKTLYDTFTPPAGGVNVQFGTSAERCSLGLPVLANNVPSYLIASHCSKNWGTSNDGTVLTQNATKIGDKGPDNGFVNCDTSNPGAGQCQAADTTIFTATGSFARARIIKTVGGTGSIDTGTSDTYYDVTTVSERPASGVTVSSIGASSGFRDATVVNADTDVVYSGYTPPRVIRRVIEVNRSASGGVAAACGGDSGGPWFQITGTNTAKFLGITSGSSTDAPTKTRPDGLTVSCGYTAYFSPVAMIRVAYPNVTFTLTR